MTTVGTSDWDVEAQYRATDSFPVISDWVTMSSIDPISEGNQDLWTECRKLGAITDATGRIFQFSLKLISNKPSVSPRVFDGVIKSDMPDRIESYFNLTAPTSGYTLNYVPEFKGPSPSPAVQISMDNALAGDHWEFVSKSVSGFTIRFLDSTNTPVSRVFDAMVKGYGRKNDTVI